VQKRCLLLRKAEGKGFYISFLIFLEYGLHGFTAYSSLRSCFTAGHGFYKCVEYQ
jgi:hypothetical protein